MLENIIPRNFDKKEDLNILTNNLSFIEVDEQDNQQTLQQEYQQENEKDIQQNDLQESQQHIQEDDRQNDQEDSLLKILQNAKLNDERENKQNTQQKKPLHLQSLTEVISKPIWDLLDRGGKRFRPVFCGILAECFEKQMEDILEIAAVTEIIHNGSLIIDDIEDSSQIRRDKLCVHIIYGLDASINAGNMMYYAPFLKLLHSDKYTDQQKLQFSIAYAEEMTSAHVGQGWDISWHNQNQFQIPTEQEYLQMVSHKTGALLRLPTRLVCIYLNIEEKLSHSLQKFSERIGVAFQIQDDVLNLQSFEYSKTKGQIGEDIYEGKMSLIAIHCLNNSNQQDKERFLQILRMQTNDQDLVVEAIAIVNKSRSIEYSINLANKLIEDSWNNDIEQNIKDSEAKSNLKLLAEYIIRRKI